jgi:formate hydrogenlyase subunit 6/NADH:ubiquinone oxidoreductase subunit I
MDDRFCFSGRKHILPRINGGLCTGCGKCVDVCPTGALDLVEGRATIVRPELCSYCSDCEELCSKEAIACPFEVVFEEDVEDD